MNERKVKIKWLIDILKISKQIWSFGICEETKQIAFLACEPLTPIAVHDVYINGTCEDGAHCLNLGCPLNKTTVNSLKKGFKWAKVITKKPELLRLCKHLRKCEQLIAKEILAINWNEPLKVSVYDKPLLKARFEKQTEKQTQ